jgi:quercetin dioxygenase-like cupin family protein
MKHSNSYKRNNTAGIIVALILTTGTGYCALAARASHPGQQNTDRKVRMAAEQTLPQLDGGKLKATLVEVTYAPGAGSAPHSHPCPVIGYVVSGELRTQVKGGAEARYRAGETFYEPPNGVHLVSANASKTEPAKLLAIFVCDHEAELSTPVPSENEKGTH